MALRTKKSTVRRLDLLLAGGGSIESQARVEYPIMSLKRLTWVFLTILIKLLLQPKDPNVDSFFFFYLNYLLDI